MEKQQKAYKGVIDYFKKKIMDGELRPGEKLPPERDIAEQLNVSRNSVREAIRIMDMTGVISSQQGSGNYITCEFQKSIAETMGMMFAMSQINYQHIIACLQTDQSDSPDIGVPGIFACYRACIGWADRRDGDAGKRAG